MYVTAFIKLYIEMNFFVLTTLRKSSPIPIELEYDNDNNSDTATGERCIIASASIHQYLSDIKRTIETCNTDDWDAMKKITNPYEYIHTTVPGHKYAVSRMKPLSRSFYKLIEIIKHCKLLPPAYGQQSHGNHGSRSRASEAPSSWCSGPIQTFHLAEGPGGFIEALCYLRANNGDVYHGMTLVDDRSHSCPGWKKSRSFLDRNPMVRIEFGADGTGNLLSLANYDACCEKYQQSIDFITADGGFDFSSDFNNQEILAMNLIAAEVFYAISMQKVGGTFVLKIFDMFTRVTIDLLHLLCMTYDDVIIFKPNTSRIANSEKYVVCKRFNIKTAEERGDLTQKIRSFFARVGIQQQQQQQQQQTRQSNVSGILKPGTHNTHLLGRIEEINAILGQQQIENIISTVSLIQFKTNDRIEGYKKLHVQKCVAWCEKYEVPCNKNLISTNTFMSYSSPAQQQSVPSACLL
jgi:23S rRNA U2552 (ribose-2'-O)-methylase RlmE/FtsJ